MASGRRGTNVLGKIVGSERSSYAAGSRGAGSRGSGSRGGKWGLPRGVLRTVRMPLASVVILLAVQPMAFADGWHNAALYTGDLDQWAKAAAEGLPAAAVAGAKNGNNAQLKVGVGAPAAKGNAGEKLGANRPAGNLNATQQQELAMKARNFVEVLAYMRSDNILQPEFPNFDHSLIPKYRETAFDLLKRSGSAGADAAVEQLRTLLMGGGPQGDVQGFHPDFVKQMLLIFDEGLASNQVPPESILGLLALSNTRRGGVVGKLGAAIQSIIERRLTLTRLLELIELAKAPSGQRAMSDVLTNMLRKTIAEGNASPHELAALLDHPVMNSTLRQTVVAQLRKSLDKQSIAGLFQVVTRVEDDEIRRAAWSRLTSQSPTFAELDPQIPTIVDVASEAPEFVVKEIERHLQSAFRQSQPKDADAVLRRIAQQHDLVSRIALPEIARHVTRSTGQQRATYEAAALKYLNDQNAPEGTQVAALWLMSQYSSADAVDRAAVEKVVAAFPTLQRGSFEAAGRFLQRMTGQNLGPRAGDSVSELVASQNQWRAWLKSQP